MPTIAQCFSALVASGNGQRCNSVLNGIHSSLNETDQSTGLHKSYIYKYCREEHPDQHREIRETVANILNPFLDGINLIYFGDDISVKEDSCNS